MTIQADCSIGLKRETTYGTAVVVDRFLEFTEETLDYERTYVQGAGLRPGSRVARSARRKLAKDGGAGDINLEVPSRGLGTFLEAMLGTATSTLVEAGLYQQLFTLQKSDFLPSLTIQKGIPRLGADLVDAYTFLGAACSNFEFGMANADILKLKSTWTAKDVQTDIAYATPSYASGMELFSFVDAGLTIGGTVTVPTATTLATGGTEVANVRDFTCAVDNKLDGEGYNLGGAGKRTRPPAVGIAEISGTITAEYDSTTFRDAVRDQSPLSLVANFAADTEITAGNPATLQIVIPDIRFEGELPKSNGGEVITQKLDYTGFDGLVAPHALYIVVRTADTAL